LSNTEPVIRKLIQDRAIAKSNELGWKAAGAKYLEQIAEIINPAQIAKEAGKDKDGGSKTVEMHGAKFSIEAEKKVSWDSAQLQAVAATLPWKVVAAIFKIKFEISEAKYKSLVENADAGMFDPEVLEKIKAARTVEIGEAKIKTAELINPQ